MIEEAILRQEMVRIARKLDARGLVAATDGNISCRAGAGRLLVTPSGVPKGDLKPEALIVTDFQGRLVEGRGRPSTELRMHLLVYRMREDVSAIVHAHPPLLTAMTIARVPFPAAALPEVFLAIGEVPTTPYATPTTDEVPSAIEPHVASHNALLLERHGSVTFGRTLAEAYLRLEKLEHAARTLIFARLLSGCEVPPLPAEALARLSELKH